MRISITLYQGNYHRKKEMEPVVMSAEKVATSKNQGEIVTKAICTYDLLKRAVLYSPQNIGKY